MSMALSAKNKTGFIDGSISKPSSSADFRYKAWIRCNNMVLSRILNCQKNCSFRDFNLHRSSSRNVA